MSDGKASTVGSVRQWSWDSTDTMEHYFRESYSRRELINVNTKECSVVCCFLVDSQIN